MVAAVMGSLSRFFCRGCDGSCGDDSRVWLSLVRVVIRPSLRRCSAGRLRGSGPAGDDKRGMDVGMGAAEREGEGGGDVTVMMATVS